MKLCDFGFLADENVHPEVVTFLGEHGRDVRAAGELGLLGAADAAIMKVAASERRVVVTHDGDFGRLAIAAGEPFVGILYLRPGHVAPAFTIRGIEELLAAVSRCRQHSSSSCVAAAGGFESAFEGRLDCRGFHSRQFTVRGTGV